MSQSKMPQSVIDAAAGHISSLESDGFVPEPKDAWENWDACSLPEVEGLDWRRQHDQELIRAMLAGEIGRQLEERE